VTVPRLPSGTEPERSTLTAENGNGNGRAVRHTGEGGALVDFGRLEDELEQLRERYSSAKPFPHIVLDNLLVPETAQRAIGEFPPLDPAKWNRYLHANERKFSNTNPDTWKPTLRSVLDELQSPRFVAFLSRLTGIEDLLIDESLEGGGLHQSVAGGFLNIHADFTVHPRHRNWRRRVNLLLYLNEEWRPEYGGDLEFWSTDMARCEAVVAPIGNRAVIFTTDADSFHGHPEPMRCPPGVARQSLALYYFTSEDHPLVRSTDYRARPGDGARSVVIYVDKHALRTYDWAKRHLGLSDRSISKFLGPVDRLRLWRHRSGDRDEATGPVVEDHDKDS